MGPVPAAEGLGGSIAVVLTCSEKLSQESAFRKPVQKVLFVASPGAIVWGGLAELHHGPDGTGRLVPQDITLTRWNDSEVSGASLQNNIYEQSRSSSHFLTRDLSVSDFPSLVPNHKQYLLSSIFL
jgi:hypothetical protein